MSPQDDGLIDNPQRSTSLQKNQSRNMVVVCLSLVFLFYFGQVEQWTHAFLTATTTMVWRPTTSQTRPKGYKGLMSDRYCEWMGPANGNASLDEIGDMCHPKLLPELKSKRFWYFFGDSTMYRLMTSIKKHLQQRGKRHGLKVLKRQKDRCDSMNYLQLPHASKWRRPNFTAGEGPAHYYGFDHHYCSDCTGCYGLQIEFGIKGQIHSLDTPNDILKQVEYFPIEFAIDKVIQTPTTRTTQETMVLYLRTQHEERVTQWNNVTTNANSQDLWKRAVDMSVCVVNVGFHDMAINPRPTKHTYAANVLNYLDELHEVCGTLVWVLMTSTRNDPHRPQSNKRVTKWNAAVNTTLRKLRPAVYRLNPYRFSEIVPHDDNVHMNREEYYDPMAVLFGDFMDP